MSKTTLHLHETFPYTTQELYDVVADVAAYPLFLPWCQKAEIIEKKERCFIADLTIGYGPFSETFRSLVHLCPHENIRVDYQKGPFKYLENEWSFEALDKEQTLVKFYIAFEFRNYIFQKAMEKVFRESSRYLMGKFLWRVQEEKGVRDKKG